MGWHAGVFFSYGIIWNTSSWRHFGVHIIGGNFFGLRWTFLLHVEIFFPFLVLYWYELSRTISFPLLATTFLIQFGSPSCVFMIWPIFSWSLYYRLLLQEMMVKQDMYSTDTIPIMAWIWMSDWAEYVCILTTIVSTFFRKRDPFDQTRISISVFEYCSRIMKNNTRVGKCNSIYSILQPYTYKDKILPQPKIFLRFLPTRLYSKQ